MNTSAPWPEVTRGSVLYESFAGNGMLCNPEAIFSSLLDDPRYEHLTHTWSLRKPALKSARARFGAHPRVRLVEYRTPDYFSALSASQYVINNATFPAEFGPSPDQTYVNTWHGTPLKHMGYAIPNGGPDTRNIIRNFVNSSVLMSSSPFMTRAMYAQGYRLGGLYRGRLIEDGQPRTDRQNLGSAEKAGVHELLATHGIEPDGRSTILYAPTWKGESFYKPDNDVAQLRRVVAELSASVDATQWRVLLKVHQVIATHAAKDPVLKGVLVPNDVPANVVLGITDVLITDYSSIGYDFLATGRPILYYAPDFAAYASGRGLYQAPHTWPGLITDNVQRLAAEIDQIDPADPRPLPAYAQRYVEAQATFVPHDDGQATRRLVDEIFEAPGGAHPRVVEDLNDRSKPSILIYLGGLQPNGITTAGINLLRHLDYERFDVSVTYTHNGSADRRAAVAEIDPRARLLPRIAVESSTFDTTRAAPKPSRPAKSALEPGGRTASGRVKALLKRLGDTTPEATNATTGTPAAGTPTLPDSATLEVEWRRCFGASEFDHIIDFGGYGPAWSALLLCGQARSHAIWLHNELAADAERELNGDKVLQTDLRQVFSLYSRYDRLVSVSASLAEVNRATLAEYAAPEAFVSVPNTIDVQRIQAFSTGRNWTPGGQPDGRVMHLPGDDIVTAIGRLLETYSIADVRQEVTRRATVEKWIHPDPDHHTFITVGRLSPEKNHARLIEAFGLVHQEHPNTHLVIVGRGPLEVELKAQVAAAQLGDAVLFTGFQRNPFAMLAAADCFVLSSDYEGQPMVILEALALGRSVVTTRFDSVASALPSGTGLVVDRTSTALAEGMRASLAGVVPNPPFDADAYNAAAIQQFYAAALG